MDILKLLTKPEGKTLEFKRDLSSPGGVLRSIIAFANTAGGILVVGVDDKSHNIRGVADPLKMEERIANLVSDTIHPKILPEIDIIPWRDTYVIAIRVYPGSCRPHYLQKHGKDAGVYVRVGSTNRRADTETIQELERVGLNESYDELPMIDLCSEALDFRAASEQFSAVRQIKPKDLETLNLVTTYQGQKVPTIAGMILFGKEREKYFPNAWIQAGRFDGVDKTSIIDSVEIRDYPVDAVERAVSFIEKHATRAITIHRVRHSVKWSIPQHAVRESIVNAVVHADYSQHGSPIRIAIYDDRIEIENPGLLRFGLTVSDIKSGISKLRNRTIGKIFNLLGLIEQWGSGIQRIMSSCQKSGLPQPLFQEIATHFRVTLFTVPQSSHAQRLSQYDKTDRAILMLLTKKQEQGLTTSHIAKHIKLSTRATRTRLLKLIENGDIVDLASSENDPNRQYYLSEKDE